MILPILTSVAPKRNKNNLRKAGREGWLLTFNEKKKSSLFWNSFQLPSEDFKKIILHIGCLNPGWHTIQTLSVITVDNSIKDFQLGKMKSKVST